MAYSTGARRTIPFKVNTGTKVGQGTRPVAWVLLSYDDVAEPTPEWVDVTADVRSFTTNRGRDNEQATFEAGTATVVLDNTNRQYDPSAHSYIRPLIRLWIMEQFNGITNDVFYGYVEQIQQAWPAPGMSDATSTMVAVDEFKVLALDALPNMNPPKDTYADMVAFDNPTSYWRWSDANLTSTTTIRETELQFVGPFGDVRYHIVKTPVTVQGFQDWTVGNGVGFTSSFADGPIVGDLQSISEGVGGFLDMQSAGPYDIDANSTDIGDPMGGTKYTAETWFRKTGNPLAAFGFLVGPESNVGGQRTWFLQLNTGGTLSFVIYDSGGTARTVTSVTVLANDTWYHVAGELDGATLRIFVNGVQDNTASSGTGIFRPTNSAGATATIQGSATVSHVYLDETALYLSTAVPAARLLAHYDAGANKGFRGGPSLGLAHLRAGGILDSIVSDAPRYIRAGTRGMQPVFQHGQDPLAELRKCAVVEMPDGVLFVGKDGTVTLLDAAHRGVSPWDTVQMTFDDQASSGWQYEDLATDYSDSFIVNQWDGSRAGGELITASDATSISKYGKRAQTISDLPLTDTADVTTITSAMLAKYKNPHLRVLTIELDCSDLNILNEVFQRELCDRVRIIRTLPGGGTFDQTLFIQKIEVEAHEQDPWKVRLGVGDAEAGGGLP